MIVALKTSRKLGRKHLRYLMFPGGALTWETLPSLAARVAAFGWHINLQLHGEELVARERAGTAAYAPFPEKPEGLVSFEVRREDGTPVVAHLLSLTPFRRIVKDYFMICDSYYQAIRTATPDKIEAIDMGRRGIHDEGSRTLQERLAGKVRIDFETARRLFTLISVLHWKG